MDQEGTARERPNLSLLSPNSIYLHVRYRELIVARAVDIRAAIGDFPPDVFKNTDECRLLLIVHRWRFKLLAVTAAAHEIAIGRLTIRR